MSLRSNNDAESEREAASKAKKHITQTDSVAASLALCAKLDCALAAYEIYTAAHQVKHITPAPPDPKSPAGCSHYQIHWPSQCPNPRRKDQWGASLPELDLDVVQVGLAQCA